MRSGKAKGPIKDNKRATANINGEGTAANISASPEFTAGF